jgi:hypothetical protein
MRKTFAVTTAVVVIALVSGTAGARPHSGIKHRHGPSGIRGVVLNSTCPGPCTTCPCTTCLGPCAYPAPPPPTYSGESTVTIRRAGDGTTVATVTPVNGSFRVRLRRGWYDVTAAAGVGPAAAMPSGCWQGETVRVRVRRHRFTHVELHVANYCIV